MHTRSVRIVRHDILMASFPREPILSACARTVGVPLRALHVFLSRSDRHSLDWCTLHALVDRETVTSVSTRGVRTPTTG